jgi:hypothetical protein
MDLKGNRITVAELTANPAVMAYLRKEHRRLSPELLEAAQTLTLGQLLGFANLYLPKKKVEKLMEDLRSL